MGDFLLLGSPPGSVGSFRSHLSRGDGVDEEEGVMLGEVGDLLFDAREVAGLNLHQELLAGDVDDEAVNLGLKARSGQGVALLEGGMEGLFVERADGRRRVCGLGRQVCPFLCRTGRQAMKSPTATRRGVATLMMTLKPRKGASFSISFAWT